MLSPKLGTHTRTSSRRFARRILGRSKKRLVRFGILSVNLFVIIGVVFFVAQNRTSGEASHQNALTKNQAVTNPLDQISSADIAVHVAHLTALPETNAVINHADTFNAQLGTTVTSNDTTIVSKPQIISTPAQKSNKDIVMHTVVRGDTVAAIADKYHVSADAVRWSNGLSGNSASVGAQLFIPPVEGIVYIVKAGDTVESLAQKYSSNKDQIAEFNDAETTGIKPGEKVVIPNGSIAAPRSTFSSSLSTSASGGFTAAYSNNGYDYGWCTWWAAKRRADIGRPIPSNLGNAITWASLARRAGYAVDSAPAAGDVAYYRTIGGLGHVGFVEQVTADGNIWISDMNYYGVSVIGGSASAGGWGRTSYHMVTPAGFSGFYFIH